MHSHSRLLEPPRAHPAFAWAPAARAVSALTGKSRRTQRAEIFALRRGPGMIKADEYYYLRLFENTMTDAERQQFLGSAAQVRILRHCTKDSWRVLVHDKLVYSAYIPAMGFDVPRTTGLYHPDRSCPGAASLRSPQQLADFLRHRAEFPLFGKPADGMYSVGAVRLERYDAATDSLTAYSGAAAPVDEVVREIHQYFQSGYILQALEHPDAETERVCGDRLACIRMVILVGHGRPILHRALWKIPSGSHIADNFWRPGNMLGDIDLASGEIRRVVAGAGPQQKQVETHPDTGARLTGFVLPDWDRLKTCALEAAATIPGVRIQGWDVASSARGPLLVEVNVGGGFTLPQLASGTGLLDPTLQEFLSKVRYAPPPALSRTVMASVTALGLDRLRHA